MPWWQMKAVGRSGSSVGAHSLKRLKGSSLAPSTRASSYSSGSRTSTSSKSSPPRTRSPNSFGVKLPKPIPDLRREVNKGERQKAKGGGTLTRDARPVFLLTTDYCLLSTQFKIRDER